MKVKIFSILAIFIVAVCSMSMISLAEDSTLELSTITSGMKNVNQVSDTSGKIATGLNRVIRLIQIAGSGISVIVVTLLGAKYMLASSGEKADIKKMAVPIVIGCVLLFAASNIVAIVASVGDGMN